MTMFLGKILDEGITAPERITNSLPPDIIYRDGKYFRKGKPESELTVTPKTNLQKISKEHSEARKPV